MDSSVTPTIVRRPLLSIQCNWDEVLRDSDSAVWVSCREFGSSSKNGKLKSFSSSENKLHSFSASDNFQAEKVTDIVLRLSHQDPNCSCDFHAPSKVFSKIHTKSISSIDVTAELGVSVSSENELKVWDASTGAVLRILQGHKFDVYSCRFFPSGIVILSCGADMQIKIWAADTGVCPVTLFGHHAAVTDTAIVDRGRNIVSVSKDGTIRLWDCGKSACIDVVSEENGSINCCSLGPVDIDVGTPETPPSDREISTDGKLVVIGSETGLLKGVGLQSRKQIFHYRCDSAVNCCCFVSTTSLAFGTHDGKIWLFDLRARLPVTIWEESSSPVLCLLAVKNGLFCGRADGSSIYISFHSDKCIQLTGPDFDQVYCMAYNGSSIYTGSKDGLLLTLGNNEFLIFHIKRSPFGLFITGISSSVSLFEDLKSVSLDIKKRLMALLPIVYNALDKTLIDKAAEELRENEGNLSTGLKQLRQLIEKESIVCPRDDAFLTMFLRAKKWNVQRSFYQLKMYCHVRLQHERIYGCYELEAVRKVLSLSVCGLLPARDHEGRVVIFIRLNQFDADFMSGEDVMTTLKLLAHFVIQYHATQINGLCFISNCWLKSLRHAQILMKTLANTLSIISHFPARIRRVDNVNSNVLFQTAFSLLKVIVPLKVFKRCTFLGDQKEVLPQIYPPSILPEEFGGTLGPLKDIKNEWMSDFEKYVLKYKAESSYYFEK